MGTVGFTKLFSVLTHQSSQGIASSRNANELYRVSFKEFQFEGGHPLAKVPIDSCSVVLLDLDDHTSEDRYHKRMAVLTDTHQKRLAQQASKL